MILVNFAPSLLLVGFVAIAFGNEEELFDAKGPQTGRSANDIDRAGSSSSSSVSGSSTTSTSATTTSTTSTSTTPTSTTPTSTTSTSTSTTTITPNKCTGPWIGPDPADCKRYYKCVESSPGIWQVYHFTCTGLTIFNPVTLMCDVPANVIPCPPNCDNYC